MVIMIFYHIKPIRKVKMGLNTLFYYLTSQMEHMNKLQQI